MTPASATTRNVRPTALFDISRTSWGVSSKPEWVDAFSKLASLKSLGADWDGYDALPVDPVALRAADRLLLTLRRGGYPEPTVFPVPDGGVQLEWLNGPVQVEIEIQPAARRIVFVSDDPRLPEGIDGELPADTDRFTLVMQRLIANS